jgi:hypothetical protein
VGETTARIEVRPGPTVNFLSRLHSAIQASAAPVAVHWSDGCLRLVAKTADAARISLIGDNNVSLDDESQRRVDRDGIGFVIRLPGVLLSWILVSLGAPFWYDLLKKLVGFRSLLAKKDEDDRNLRQQQQQQTPPVAGGGGAAQTGAAPSRDTIAGGEDERGDLSATGAAG